MPQQMKVCRARRGRVECVRVREGEHGRISRQRIASRERGFLTSPAPFTVSREGIQRDLCGFADTTVSFPFWRFSQQRVAICSERHGFASSRRSYPIPLSSLATGFPCSSAPHLFLYRAPCTVSSQCSAFADACIVVPHC